MGKSIKNLTQNPDADLWRECLKSILLKKKAFYFRQPVDYVALNIPHYPKIVKKPMDLGTVGTKLGQNAYRTLNEFASDVRLIFSNALKFNTDEKHEVHIAAKLLSAFFEIKVDEIKRGNARATRAEAARPAAPRGRPCGAFASAPRAAHLPPATTRGAARAAAAPPAAKKGRRGAAPKSPPREDMVPAAAVLEMQAKLAQLREQMLALQGQVAPFSPEASTTDDSDKSFSDGEDEPLQIAEGGESPRPHVKIRFRVPKALVQAENSARAIGASDSTDSLDAAVSVVTTPDLPLGELDASLDGSLDDDLSPEDAARLRSSLVELSDEDREVAGLAGQKRGERGGTPRPLKKHRFAMSPADAAAAPSPATMASLFRGPSDPASDAGAIEGVELEFPAGGSTSPLWAFPDEPLAPLEPLDAAE